MTILSVYPLPLISYTHDGSSAILKRDAVLWGYEEEKVERFQHTIGQVPEKSAVLGLKHSNIRPEEAKLLVVTSMDRCWERVDYDSRVAFLKDILLLEHADVVCIPHHLAHSALAVLTSAFENCLFLTFDAGGDGHMGHWGVFTDGQFSIVEECLYSPAILYGFLCSLAGFGLFEEGKLMGLSAYGEVNQELYRWLRDHFAIAERSASLTMSDDLKLKWRSELLLHKAEADTMQRHKYFRLKVDFCDRCEESALGRLSQFHPIEVAATGQRVFEELVSTAVRNIVQETGINKVCLSGGAFLNVRVNNRLQSERNMSCFVPVAPHDAGLALGAGLYTAFQKGDRTRSRATPLSPYLGPEFGEREIEALLSDMRVPYHRSACLLRETVDLLESGKVVGWFQGRGEFGARALGARSILGDPRDWSIKARLNQLLKRRDWFMPYAPSILEEYGDDFFLDFVPSPYMNRAFRVRPEKLGLIPGAVHVDGTCRAHTVSRESNNVYRHLIEQFYARTNVPMVLNTSFNRHGTPIVCTPRQAIEHFLEWCVDALVLGPFIVVHEGDERPKGWVMAETDCVTLERLKHIAFLLEKGHEKAAVDAARNLPDVNLQDGKLLYSGKILWARGTIESSLENVFRRFIELGG